METEKVQFERRHNWAWMNMNRESQILKDPLSYPLKTADKQQKKQKKNYFLKWIHRLIFLQALCCQQNAELTAKTTWRGGVMPKVTAEYTGTYICRQAHTCQVETSQQTSHNVLPLI